MMRKYGIGSLTTLLFLILLIFFSGCNQGIEDSPLPGILRISLESDPADTVIVIVTDTITVSEGDEFQISIFQGRVFQENTYSILYPELPSYSQEERFYNLIERENNQYLRFQIFETYVPPAAYTQIEYGIDSYYLKLRTFDRIEVITPTNYFLKLPTNFEINENRVTEVNVRVSPFKYITRVRDSYYFQPEMEVIGVTYY